jgi:putative ABC transport system permease protein
MALTRGPVPLRFALRELRAGLSGFRILLACLAIGVAAIALAGSVNSSITEGMRADAQALLGGDLEVRLLYREIAPEERKTLESLGTLSLYTEMRTMAGVAGDRTRRSMVELKGVDGAYPLYGAITLSGVASLDEALAVRDGLPGAAAPQALLDRLGIALGDRLTVGETEVVLRAVIDREPDLVTGGFGLGPRLMVAASTVDRTGLIQPGSLVEYHYLLRLNPGVSAAVAKETLESASPDAGWRVRDTSQAGGGFQRFVDRLTVFLVLVGLTSLLVGGIGVANAVKAYMDGRTRTIAALKCLGAPSSLIFRVYLIQTGLVAALGILVGLVIGGGLPPLILAVLGDRIPVPTAGGVFLAPLLQAAAFGLLTALAFGLWPLARARAIPATALFRGQSGMGAVTVRRRDILAVGLIGLALAALTVLGAKDSFLALWFVLGAGAALLLFRGAAWAVMALARRIHLPRGATTGRLALTNLYRPGAPTPSVVLSLGLGLTVLVAVALVEGNLNRQIREDMPNKAPTFFFIDIQSDQSELFRDTVLGAAPGADILMADMIRGRIRALKGVPVDQVAIAEDSQWAVRGDRGFTTSATLPENSTLKAGEWWPEDYSGPPLFSLTADLAQGMGLVPGDEVTVNILGRDITGTIASTREVDWASLSMNFAFVVSPGAFAGAPRTYIATVRADADRVPAIEAAVAEAAANVSIIRVDDALAVVVGLMEDVGAAVRAAAGITLVAGILVLAGSFAANHGRRLREAVTLKVLGATRGMVLRAYLTEYGILGFATGLIAALVGSVAAWAVLVFVMRAEWVFLPGVVAGTLAVCVGFTVLAGFAGTWGALGARPAPYLRNE